MGERLDVAALVKLAQETKAIVEAPGVSPAPWKTGTGYEQSDRGNYVSGPSGIVCAEQDGTDCVLSTEDAALLAHGRTALPLLVDGVLVLAEENARLLAERDDARRDLLLVGIRSSRAWVCAVRSCPGMQRSWNAPARCPACKQEDYVTQGSNDDPRVVAHDETLLREATVARGWMPIASLGTAPSPEAIVQALVQALAEDADVSVGGPALTLEEAVALYPAAVAAALRSLGAELAKLGAEREAQRARAEAAELVVEACGAIGSGASPETTAPLACGACSRGEHENCSGWCNCEKGCKNT